MFYRNLEKKKQKPVRKATKMAKIKKMENVTIFPNYVATKVQDIPENFVAIIKSLSQQRVRRMAKRTVERMSRHSITLSQHNL